jgi:hypothetical protein
MTIQQNTTETIITIPNTVRFEYLQAFLDYLSVKTTLSQSQATEEDIMRIAEEAQANWWTANKDKFLR